MKKSLLLSFGIVGLAAASLALAPSLANAQGANGRGYQNSLDRKAKVLGIDAEKLKIWYTNLDKSNDIDK